MSIPMHIRWKKALHDLFFFACLAFVLWMIFGPTVAMPQESGGTPPALPPLAVESMDIYCASYKDIKEALLAHYGETPIGIGDVDTTMNKFIFFYADTVDGSFSIVATGQTADGPISCIIGAGDNLQIQQFSPTPATHDLIGDPA